MTATLEAAEKYTRHGWRVVPIPHQSKSPGIEGWPDLRLEVEDLPHHFAAEPMNLGVLLGEPSGGLLDIDLDQDLAVELADRHLPETPAVFGRAGKPRSHRIYRIATPIKTKRFRSPEQGTIVEIRSTGAQTVFPPSTHPSGELIKWEDPAAEPVEVDGDELIQAVQRLHDAVMARLGEGTEDGDPDVEDTPPIGAIDASLQQCLVAMKRMKMQDRQDGSHRLFAAACRAFEHDLSDSQAIACINTYAMQRPFPRPWTDEEILQRVRDAEDRCERGTAFAEDGEASIDRSQATILVSLCDDVEFFHHDDRAYVTLKIGARTDTLPLRGRGFKRWLARRFFTNIGKAPNSQALSDAIGVLEGKALFEGPEHAVHVRLAEHEGEIYLDLADAEGNVIHVTEHGWEVVTISPVRFRRPRGLLPLPVPTHGGSIADLRQFINVESDEDFMLLTGWLVAALRPGRPVPVLAFSSEQGSGKSTASRLLRNLIDPNEASIRSEPREVRDLMIAASNGLVVAYDNLSRIQPWLSDAMCRLSTGGGFSTRVLYENDEEMIFNALRPVVLNGIEELGSRSDLLDRTIRVSLPSIPEDKRRPEQEIYDRFEQARPGILGALMTAVSAGLRNIQSVELERLPRMADFARWVVAAESVLPWERGAFMQAYADNRAGAHDLALETSLISDPLRRLAEAHGDWRGRATELLHRLEELTDEKTVKQRGWPKQPHVLSGVLRRLAPNLRAVGVIIEFPIRTGDGRELVVRYVPKKSVTSVTERHAPADTPANGFLGDAPVTNGDAPVTHSSRAQVLDVTQRDARDALLHWSSAITCEDDFEERAAIMEFDGGLTREQAEAETRRWARHPHNGLAKEPTP